MSTWFPQDADTCSPQGVVSPRRRRGGARRRTPEARTLVFVYGTLLTGECNHRYLGGARLVAEARTQPTFRLHDLGPFPGLVPGGEDAILGEVYAVDKPTLANLDRLEEHPQFYRRTAIVLEGGTGAETYLLTPEQVAGHPVIVSGSWRRKEYLR